MSKKTSLASGISIIRKQVKSNLYTWIFSQAKAGVPLKNVSSRLGHADIRTTANIYGQALHSVDRQAADKMDQYLKKTAK
jgi:integrase